MNERIKLLAEEANCNIDGMGYGEGNLEQFAELIVRECAKIASNADLEDVDGGDSAVLRAASEQIKQHFGVE